MMGGKRTTYKGRLRVVIVAWLVLVLYNEFGLFYRSIRKCNIDGTEIIIIADPQLVDEHTYNRRGILLRLTKLYTDIYMRRNYFLISRYRSPLHVFLGDLMDGGREIHDDLKWETEVRRFQSVFPSSHLRMNVVGNHDIGFGNGVILESRKRFEEYFGSVNQEVTIGGYSVLSLDTPSISATDATIANQTAAFLERVSRQDTRRIIFSHVPLARPLQHDCGSLRESPHGIHATSGYQFQSLLSDDVSSKLLRLKPRIIFSGDDHDYCEYLHYHETSNILEVSVKSFSWAMGVQYPGFQILSLNPIATRACILPSQLHILITYAVSLIATIILLSALAVVRPLRRNSLTWLPDLDVEGAKEYDKLWKPQPRMRVWSSFWADLGKVTATVLPFYIFLVIWWS